MATVIDTLLIAVGFDYKPVAAGRKEVEKELDKTKEAFHRRGRDIEGISKGVEGGLERVIKKASALFLMFAGASSLMGFVRSTLAADAASGTFANTMGLSVKLVSQYEQAIQRVTGTVAGAKESFQSFTTQIEGVNSSFGTVDPAFSKAMGFLLPEVDPYAHTADELFKMIADRVPKNPKLKPVFAENMRQAGIAPGMVDFLMKGGDYVRKTLGETSKTAVTDAQSEKAMKFLNDMKAIENELTSIAHAVLEPLMPSLLALLEALDRFLEKNREWIKQHLGKGIDEITEAIKKLNLREIADDADKVAKAFGGWTTVLEGLFALWAGSKATRLLAALGLMRGFSPGGLVALLAALGVGVTADAMNERYNGENSDLLPRNNLGALLSSSGMQGPKAVKASDEDIADVMEQLVTEGGYSPAAAAGWVGNMLAESSGLDPREDGDNHKAKGIIQIHPDERKPIEEHFHKRFEDMTRREQVAGLIWLMKNNPADDKLYKRVQEQLTNVGGAGYADPEFATSVVMRGFERPADQSEDAITGRMTLGRKAYTLYQSRRARGGAPGVSTTPTLPGQPGVPGTQVDPSAPTMPGNRRRPPSVYVPPAVPPIAPYGTTGPSLTVPPASTPSGPIGRTGYDNTRLSLNIGAVTVHTQATDARGIARDFRGAIAEQLAQSGVAVRGNFGLA